MANENKELLSLESEAGFKTLFTYATVGILVISKDGKIELINPCAEKLFNYSNAELIGQQLEILIPESLRKKHEHHREGYFEKPKARPMGLGMDLYARRRDGHVFPIEISLGHYEIGGNLLAVAFVTDITSRKEMENAMKKTNEELEQKVKERTQQLTIALSREIELNELKSRFVSIASHEFRTPLSAILSSVSLIEHYKDPSQLVKRDKHIERIKTSVRNLTGILSDFLSLDKLEQGKLEVEVSDFDLKEFLLDAIDEMEGMARKKEQRIHYSHSGPTSVQQDKKILRNVFLNLVSNAIKYSPPGKEIHIECGLSGDQVSLSVRDEGIGIPEEEQKHLFEKFFRAKNVSEEQGTGLGLNIVKKYMDLIHGTIAFSSREYAGTTFTIEFPKSFS